MKSIYCVGDSDEHSCGGGIWKTLVKEERGKDNASEGNEGEKENLK